MNGMNRCCGHKMYATPVAQPVMEEAHMYKCGKQMHHAMPEAMAPMAPVAPVAPMAPMAPMMPAKGHYETVTRVVEPTVYCRPEYHHYHKVEHVVPVAVKAVHHHHTQHDYVVCKQCEEVENHQYNHGLQCEKDVCELANICKNRR